MAVGPLTIACVEKVFRKTTTTADRRRPPQAEHAVAGAADQGHSRPAALRCLPRVDDAKAPVKREARLSLRDGISDGERSLGPAACPLPEPL
jgi:hypothetical protein